MLLEMISLDINYNPGTISGVIFSHQLCQSTILIQLEMSLMGEYGKCRFPTGESGSVADDFL